MGYVGTMTLHHIPTMLAYLPSALYTKCTDMSSVGWPGRKMVLFYCSREGVRGSCEGEGETRACDRKAQSFCLEHCTPVRITFSLESAEGHSADTPLLTVHHFSLA